jgi:hypothetical protein
MVVVGSNICSYPDSPSARDFPSRNRSWNASVAISLRYYPPDVAHRNPRRQRPVLADVRDCGGVKQQIEETLTKDGKKKPEILVWQVDMMDYESGKQFTEKAKGL